MSERQSMDLDICKVCVSIEGHCHKAPLTKRSRAPALAFMMEKARGRNADRFMPGRPHSMTHFRANPVEFEVLIHSVQSKREFGRQNQAGGRENLHFKRLITL